MCNAWNHWKGCTCGFGGDTGGGGVVTHRAWSLFDNSREAVTRPTTCWICGASVYFYRDENGGCALFDQLGAPWQVHPCWDLHRRERSYAMMHVNNTLVSAKYRGTIDLWEYEDVDPPSRTSGLRTLTGVVARKGHYSTTMGPHPDGAGEWIDLSVLCGKRVYPVLVPKPVADLVPNNVPVEVTVRWIRHPDETNLFACTLTRYNGNGTLRFQRKCARIDSILRCEYCGRRVDTNEDWGFDQNFSLECHPCANLRRGMPPSKFISTLKRIVKINGGTEGS